MEREIHNPSPSPPGSGSCVPPRLKRSKMLSASPSGRPGPASSTHALICLPSLRAPTRTAVPSGANLLALAMRLTNTCVSRMASPCNSTPAGTSTSSVWRRWCSSASTSPRASSTTSAISMLCRRTSSWPDSMRTLSSRLSMSRVRRSVPRSSDSTSSSSFSGGLVFNPSRSSSMDASCAASGVRNSCETFASTVSRARRTPSSSVSSRRTCTCMPLTTRELVMTVWRNPIAGLKLLHRLGAARLARTQDRARGGRAGTRAFGRTRPARRASARRRRTCRSPPQASMPNNRAACGLR